MTGILKLDKDEKVNWFLIIIDLERAGYSHSAIAAAIGSAKSTVQGWKGGATPKWDEGEKLLALWETVTKNGRETVHRVKRYSHLA